MGKSLHLTTCAVEMVGDFVVVAQATESPGDEEWRRNIALQTSIPAERVRVLVWTDGGAPNAKQRAALAAALKGTQPLSAVVTPPSSIARAVGTAIRWFNPQLGVFSHEDIEAALNHLGVQGLDRQRLVDTVYRLRAELVAPARFRAAPAPKPKRDTKK